MKDTTKLRLIKILAIVLLALLYIIIEAFALAPSRLTISYHTYYTDQISEDLDEFSIIFFSDLHLGTTYTSSNIQVIQDKINLLQGDIVLFGGDLLDHPSLLADENEIEALVTMLSGIEAKYGKYAVLGNHDLETKDTENTVIDILERGGFEIITNTSLRVHAGSDSSIRLIGLDSGVNGDPNVSKAYIEVRGSDLNVLLCHTPDSISTVNSALTDIMVSGHSHGHQVYIPLISQYFLPAQGQNYNRGEYYLNDSYLLVSNGVGTTKIQARLFAESEINFLRLRYKAKEENTIE
ncbi:MAG: metallophosphoesterase [Erysipelotrichales bacterium]|nr:metallophosphoesterase [Erysipelotrichales bacterium]